MATDRTQPKRAVAIIYDETLPGSAPRVVAGGRGLVAERIINTAREAGVHIHEDPNLVELLARVPTGEQIPVELYQTVADVLAFVYQVNERFKDKLVGKQCAQQK
ncbi:MAG: EscU/YscU/HrcU family type III secretion system export apparatus switch protein [Desulfopila sp.]